MCGGEAERMRWRNKRKKGGGKMEGGNVRRERKRKLIG